MTLDEKVFIGLALGGIAAVILWRNRDVGPTPDKAADELPATAYVGLSQTPANSSIAEGPMYGNYNGPYLMWPPLNNFLPTVTSGQGGQVVQQPFDFVRRWSGALYNKAERIVG